MPVAKRRWMSRMTPDLLPFSDWSRLKFATEADVYRAATLGGDSRLVVLLKPHFAAEAAFFEREFRAAPHLDTEFAAPALYQTELEGRRALVLADPGGASVDQVWQSGRPIQDYLRLAIAITHSLCRIHAAGLVHADVRPDNLLIDAQGKASFLGFGYSFAEPGEDASPKPLEASRLPFISPEQTGRLNLNPDTRSDLYSLGVVLYQLLTGRLPFMARTPTEWMHSHLAKQPLPPGRWVSDIPSVVAAIVVKLLAKSPEERYQTAQGLEADLQRCLDALRSGSRPGFELGSQDARGRLIIPNRLYGRDLEIAQLIKAFDSVAASGSPGVVMIAGAAGTGKSALVKAFRQTLDPTRYIYAQGKFDQLAFASPYATVVSALRDLVRDHLVGHPAGDQMMDTIRRVLGVNSSLLANLFPELGALLGEQPELPPIPISEAQNRLNLTLTRLLGVFATPVRPLILFLDDLQWMDQATADFIDGILDTGGVRNLLLIGAYRDSEIEGRPADLLLKATDRYAAETWSLELAPLTDGDVLSLVSDSLGAPRAEILGLADAIESKTGGNPLFVTQLLESLTDVGAITFDRRERSWRWQTDAIEKVSGDSVLDLLSWKLDRLAPGVQRLLSAMALLGNSAHPDLINLAADGSANLFGAIEDGVTLGLVVRNGDALSFFHDRLQEAAYRLIPSDERASSHLRLARKMMGETGDVPGTRIFDTVQQFTHALHLVEGAAERLQVARLYLTAGSAAAARSSALKAAIGYYETGASIAETLVGPEAEALLFEFDIGIADCELMTGSPAEAEARLNRLKPRATSLKRLARVTWSQITLFTALGQFDAAISLLLEFLSEVDVHWSARPSWDNVLVEFEPIAAEIRKGSVGDRSRLPPCEGEQALVLDVLSAALPPAFFSDVNLVCLILCRMANISLGHGNGGSSALGYAYLGMVLGPMFGDYPAAHAFGRLGLSLVDEPRYSRFRGRVAMTYAYHVSPYVRPIRSSRDLHATALAISEETGDLTYAGFSTCTTISAMLFAGDSLGAVERRASAALEFTRHIGFGMITDIVTSQLMAVRSLRGSTSSLGDFDDGLFDETGFEARLESTPNLRIAACWHWIRRMQVAVVAGRFVEGREYAKKAEGLLWTSPGHLEYVEFAFYEAICIARSPAKAGGISVADLARLLAIEVSLNVLAETSPDTFAAHAALVSGERARCEGKVLDALQAFDTSISQARVQNAPHVEALAGEFAASLAEEAGLRAMAGMYRTRAYFGYRRWGASAKLQAMDLQFPDLVGHEVIAAAVTDGEMSTSFDAQSVMRLTATVSGEPVQTKMLRSLMTITLENAGAQRARLAVATDGRIRIEAEAKVLGDEIVVVLAGEGADGDGIPADRIWEALRTQETVVVGPADRGSGFRHLSSRHSALAVPLIARGKTVGVMYLENELYENAFPPARIAVIKLLATQAAIALENASLEEKASLLREVHHRVKNNLQLISSLLNLQASHVKDPQVARLFEDSRNRVRSMALVHENLYRAGNFARIAMAGHLQTLCAYLVRAHATQAGAATLRTEVDELLELDLDRAITCGLIVNELVSNALKHAFPTGEPGTVTVSLHVAKSSIYRLIVKDDGVGMEEGADKRGTLGLQLVDDLVDQLRGTCKAATGYGTSFEIEFAMRTGGGFL